MARPAAAQDDAPKVEVAGGWNYMGLRFNESEEWQHFYKGGFGEVAVNVNNRWGVVGNVGYDQKTVTDVGGDIDAKVTPYLFGVRMSSRRNEANTPFLQFLAGATRIKLSQGSESLTQTTFTWQAGGGINIKVNDVLGARVGGDYMRILGKTDSDITGDEAVQGLRLTAGIVVGFGG
jgi:hypothetical protein